MILILDQLRQLRPSFIPWCKKPPTSLLSAHVQKDHPFLLPGSPRCLASDNYYNFLLHQSRVGRQLRNDADRQRRQQKKK